MKTMVRAILMLFVFLTIQPGSFGQESSADRLLKEAEKSLNPDSYYMKAVMTTSRPGEKTRSITMETYYKKNVGSVIEILEPARSRGIRFLQKGKNLWMFNPKSYSKRAIRLSPRDSFQGSVFSNNDVGDPNFSADYTSSLKGTEVISHPDLGQVQCQVLQAVAKDRSSPYGKIIMWIQPKTHIPLRIDYFAKSGLLFKRAIFSDIKTIAGGRRPTRYTMESFELKNNVSTIELLAMEQRADLADSRFTLAALTR